jgi:hypothetical protein
MTKHIKLGPGLSTCPDPWQRFVWSIIKEADDNTPSILVKRRLTDRYNATLIQDSVEFENEAGYFMFMLEWA